MPTLGVLITYYDERELLRECLESLFRQPAAPDEVLVYDDASSAPATDYIPADLPVRVIRGEVNRGPSRGRNTLLQESTADYIHFHDADDLFHPTWCQVVRCELQHGWDAVFTEIASYRQGALVSDRVLGLERLTADPDLVRFCMMGSLLVPSGTYRRELVVEIGGYREQLWQTEDYDFHVRLALRRPTYRILPEPLVKIRIRAEGRSQKRVEVWTSAVDAVELLAGEVPGEYALDLAEAAARAGSILYKEGARGEARRAFALARRLGPPRYREQRRFYQTVARMLGPVAAEEVSSLYRSLVPQGLRGWLVRHGW